MGVRKSGERENARVGVVIHQDSGGVVVMLDGMDLRSFNVIVWFVCVCVLILNK